MNDAIEPRGGAAAQANDDARAGRRGMALVAAVWLTAVAAVAATTWLELDRARVDEFARARARTAENARLIEQSAFSLLEGHLRTLQALAQALGGELARAPEVINTLKFTGTVQDPRILLFDTAGTMIASTDGAGARSNVADRPYFRALMQPAGPNFHLGAPQVSRNLGVVSIPLAIRVHDHAGAIAGVMSAPFSPSAFKELLEGLALGRFGSASILDRLGYFLARRDVVDAGEPSVGKAFPGLPVFREAARAPVGTYSGPSGVDGIARIFSYRVMPKYDLITIASIGEDDVWQAVRARHLPVLAVAASSVLLMTLLAGVAAMASLGHARVVRNRLAAERRMRTVMDAAPEAFITIDARGSILGANLAASAIFGHSPEELAGANVSLLMPEAFAAGHDAHLERARAGGLTGALAAGREVQGLRKSGEAFPLVISVVEVEGEDGQPRYVGIARDISEYRAAQTRLSQMNSQLEEHVGTRTAALIEANRELEMFAYTIAHDLRAPTRHVVAYVAELREQLGGGASAAVRPILGAIERSARYQATLVEDLLTYARIAQVDVKREVVEPGELLPPLMALAARERPDGAAVEWHVEPLPAVMGDKVLLRQAFGNLLNNAVKFSSKKVHPVVRVWSEEAGAGMVRIAIGDNGEGFDERYAGKLFSLFERLHDTREFGGTGIGLAIVRRVIMLMGGQVRAEGKVGLGATFSVMLPSASGHQAGNTP